MDEGSDDDFLQKVYGGQKCQKCITFCNCRTLSPKERQAERQEQQMQENFELIRAREEFKDIRAENRKVDISLKSKIAMFYRGNDSKAYSHVEAKSDLSQQEMDFQQDIIGGFEKTNLGDQLRRIHSSDLSKVRLVRPTSQPRVCPPRQKPINYSRQPISQMGPSRPPISQIGPSRKPIPQTAPPRPQMAPRGPPRQQPINHLASQKSIYKYENVRLVRKR